MTGRKKNLRNQNPRSLIFAMDILHLSIGTVIVILSVMAFLSPSDHMIFFPIIFFLAALLNLVNGIQSIKIAIRDRKRKSPGICMLVFGVLLIAVGIVSTICIIR